MALLLPIAVLVGVQPNPDDRVVGLEKLNSAAFEQMKFYKLDSRHIYWIYHGNRLMPSPNVDHTSLINRAHFFFLPGDEELARPSVHPSPLHPRFFSSSQPSSSNDYNNLHATLRPIQENQASI